MEGLIPFVYKAIVEYRNGRQGGGNQVLSSWFRESPSGSYIRLPGDSGQFQASDIQQFISDYGLNSASSSTTSHIMVSSAVQSPLRHRVASA